MRSTIAAPVEFTQYGSDEWQRFCRAHGLTPSMSRRDNCWDNAVSTPDFFRSRLDVTVDPRHLLVVLALLLDWEQSCSRPVVSVARWTMPMCSDRSTQRSGFILADRGCRFI